MINGTSKLVLDNAKIIMDGDYTFSQGSIEVINNSSIEGEYNFTFSGHNLLIAKSSRLKVGNGTTFVCTPTRGSTTPIRFEDDTSTLLLDNATFKNNSIGINHNATGLVFTNGSLEIDGTSILDSVGTSTESALVLGTGRNGDGDCRLHIRPHAKLIVKNAGLIYRNNGSNGFDTSGNLGTIELRDSGNFFVEESTTPLASLGVNVHSDMNLIGQNTLTLNKNSLDLDFSKMAGQTTAGDITSLANANELIRSPGITIANNIPEFLFSPDGQYFALTRITGGGNELYIYGFNSDIPSLEQLFTFNAMGWSGYGLDLSPDSKYLISGWQVTGNPEIKLYSFEPRGNTTLLLDVELDSDVRQLKFSPDGRHVIAGLSGGAYELRVYKWDPQAVSLTQIGQFNTGAQVNSIAFSPSGQHIAIGMNTVSGNEVRIYGFDPSSTNPLGTDVAGIGGLEFGVNVNVVNFSPDGHFLIAGSETGVSELSAYRFNASPSPNLLTSLGSFSVGFAVKDANFSPDGKYVAAGTDDGISVGDPVGKLYAFDSSSATPFGASIIGSINDPSYSARAVTTATFSPNNKYLCMTIDGNLGGRLRIYEPSRSSVAPELRVDNGTVTLKQDTELSNMKLRAS